MAAAGSSVFIVTISRYETNQSFNPLVSYLHSIRYRHLLRAFARFAGQPRIKVVDVGCAYAKSFDLLNRTCDIDYLGIDPTLEFVSLARQRYGHLDNFRIIQGGVQDHLSELDGADVVLALETLEHIQEGTVFRFVEAIAKARPKLFICSVPNEIGPVLLVKNVGSFLCGYERHREYTWGETLRASTYALHRMPPHQFGHKSYDWRWLSATLRHHLTVEDIRSNPFGWLPSSLSLSVFFVCSPFPASTGVA